MFIRRGYSQPPPLFTQRHYSQITSNSILRLIQFTLNKSPHVGLVSSPTTVLDLTSIIPDTKSVYELFFNAKAQNLTIKGLLYKLQQNKRLESAKKHEYKYLLGSGLMLPAFSHPDPMRCYVTGTGLTHLGSTQARDQMHKTTSTIKTDSQKMFEMGLEGGKPPPGTPGIQPEWFFKGNGTILRGYGQSLSIPQYTTDGGEEPEIAICYLTGTDQSIHRIGFTICNEWSDHPMEKVNYLWLAPSKLRQCAIGPELLIMENFASFRGYCRILRNHEEIYNSGTLWTGEEHMSHSLENIEFHHFKHEIFRQPELACVHTLGTSKISFPNREVFREKDRIEIGFDGFGEPLVNWVHREEKSGKVEIKNQQYALNG
jgi:hypothetical protein